MSDVEKKTVLIIEDDEDLLSGYADLMELAGLNVITATDGYKGLDALSANKGKIDLVLLDMMMPGMGGLEVLATFKKDPKTYGDAPVIVLSNLTSDLTVQEALKIGATAYLLKTETDASQLVAEVKRLLKIK